LGSSKPGSPRIILKPGRDGPIRKRRHPWVYSQAVAEASSDVPPAELLPVCNAEGVTLGWGFYSPGSLIAVRMVSFTAERPADDWIESRLRAAKSLRDALAFDSDAMRLVNAEGDYLPGLVVDLYGGTVVLSMHARGIEGQSARVIAGLRGILPAARIYLKRDEHYARVEHLSIPSGFLHGEGETTTVIREGEARILVDFQTGQKTGFYLDQRANRTLMARMSRGRTMLNLFA
jgi:23S rRNA (cytosine1962-C5)-methyltransferase